MLRPVYLFIPLLLVTASLTTAPAATVKIDGSSTVYPISAAMAQDFNNRFPDEPVAVAFSGSSSGFRLITSGQIAIAGASRPIKQAELDTAAARGIELIELPVAYDGITVVVNPGNTYVDSLTVEELRAIWRPDSTVTTWQQVRASWPDRRIKLFGPGKDSGTFEYFTKAIVGKAHAARTDVVESEDDVELVQGVVANAGGMGYFGWAYFHENRDMLRAVPIVNDGKPVPPSHETILDGSYQPLARPIFIYVNKAELQRPAVRHFVDFYLDRADNVVEAVGYVSLGPSTYALVQDRFRQRRTGSVFSGRKGSVDLAQALRADQLPTVQAAARPAPPLVSSTRAVASTSGTSFVAAVDDLRDACLALSQQALADRTALGDIERQLRLVEGQLQQLRAAYGDSRLLGGQ